MEDQQEKIVQFSGGAGWELGSQNCTIPRGNWKFFAGSLVVKIAQLLERTGNQLLGLGNKNCTIPGGNWQSAAGRENFIEAGTLAC